MIGHDRDWMGRINLYETVQPARTSARLHSLLRWVSCTFVASSILLVLAVPASARDLDPRDLDDTVDWMPSFALSFGAHSQSIDGTTTSTESDLPASTGDSLISTMFQFEGKLHTPLQLDIPTHPRIFLTGGVQIPLAKELIAQRIDSDFNRGEAGFASSCPNNLDLPVPAPVDNPGRLVSTCSLEVRNRVSVDAMWYAGLGVDFTIPAFGTRFHISPAVEYFGMSIHTVGDFQRSSSGNSLSDLVETANVVGDSEIYHGISESLTLSVEVYDDGPWRWSMFIQQRVGFLLTDPFTGADSSLGTNQITFVTDLDSIAVQGTGGIQIQWTGR